MELILLKIDSNEWNYMWEWLSCHPLNSGLNDPNEALNGEEVWQYVGSYREKDRILHEFRHRLSPKTGKLEYVSVRASEKFNNEDIDKIYTIPNR